MKNLISIILISVIFVSCRNTGIIKDIVFEGELYAKNTISVKFATKTPEISTSFQWYVANTSSGEWEILKGIQTQEIVLLTGYAGKYLKCDITAWKGDKLLWS